MGRDAKGRNHFPHQLMLVAEVSNSPSPERSSFHSQGNADRGSGRRQILFGRVGRDMHLYIKHLLNIHYVPSTSNDSSSPQS